MQEFVRSEVKFTATSAFVEIVNKQGSLVTIRERLPEEGSQKQAIENLNLKARVLCVALNTGVKTVDGLLEGHALALKSAALIPESNKRMNSFSRGFWFTVGLAALVCGSTWFVITLIGILAS